MLGKGQAVLFSKSFPYTLGALIAVGTASLMRLPSVFNSRKSTAQASIPMVTAEHIHAHSNTVKVR